MQSAVRVFHARAVASATHFLGGIQEELDGDSALRADLKKFDHEGFRLPP